MGNATKKPITSISPYVLFDPIHVLKVWSNKDSFNILFDSDVDGEGSDNLLYKKLINKFNLYFIIFDSENNVFGGYLESLVVNSSWIKDANSFIFSLIRNGVVKNTKYNIKPNRRTYFKFNSQNWLYRFNDDIVVYPIDSHSSYFSFDAYEYNVDNNPLVDLTKNSNHFQVKRIMVVQMI